MTTMGISVILCCYNSADRLPETLRHLALQKIPAYVPWEIILVDNNSDDDTKDIAMQTWQSFNSGISFRIVAEQKQGLIYSRQKGVSEATFDLLLFCDDDNWLHESYVYNAYCIMHEKNNVGILGGRSDGYFETPEPLWFDSFKVAYAIGKPLHNSGIANARTFIAGAGMIMRKEIFTSLQKLNFNFILTGRRGNALSSGEDSELSLLSMLLGYDLYFDESLYFTHYITRKRLTWSYCVKMIADGHAIPQIYFFFYNYCHDLFQKGRAISFEAAYKIALRRSLNKTLKHFEGIKVMLESFKLLMISKPGSKKEIQLKAELNRLRYLLLNKKKMSIEFQQVSLLIPRLMQIKRSNIIQAV